MEWDINNLEGIVNTINKELENRTMIDIENNVFGVNERVIHKRLLRKGYKRIDNKYIEGIQKYNESIPKNNEEYNKSIPKNNEEYNKSIPKSITKNNEEYNKSIPKSITKNNEKYNKSITKVIPEKKEPNIINDIDIKSIKELIELIDPIKEVIQKYNKCITNENIIDVEPIEIKVDRNILNNEIIPVGFKLDKDIYNSWRNFTKEYKTIKNQDLLAMALLEYMKKYNRD
ncbi:MAG: hypothetical protein ACRC5M_07315 [Anaeroplasmataceae bacterium]